MSCALIKRDMQLEYAFAQAGGLLLAGPDPTGNGGVVPGFGDQREIELLVEAGFTPLEAIKVGTWNGAVYLRKQDQIGSVAVGKNADLVVVKGDPSKRIADVETTGFCPGYDIFATYSGSLGRPASDPVWLDGESRIPFL